MRTGVVCHGHVDDLAVVGRKAGGVPPADGADLLVGGEAVVAGEDPGGVDRGVFVAWWGGEPEACVPGEGECRQVQAALLVQFPYGGFEGRLAGIDPAARVIQSPSGCMSMISDGTVEGFRTQNNENPRRGHRRSLDEADALDHRPWGRTKAR
ncbi:hypothetical protein NE236_13415 [Actinoallomurus purpureus]|nr:hypothetical protein [Actinoallomurus purpureus]